MRILTQAAANLATLQNALARHIEAAKQEEARIRAEIQKCRQVLNFSAEGIDFDKVALAKTIINVSGRYASGGTDRASVVSDAIRQLSTGEPIRPYYGDLWRISFGTKNYAHWIGQRSDHEYGCGPRHGSVVFSVGLTRDVRERRNHADLTPDEIEAAIYYLTNLERVQAAEEVARVQAAA
jgi:hypothetical protein